MLKVGDTAPGFAVRDWHGNDVRLADLLPAGPVVLVFLRYTGCPLCQFWIANLAAAHDRFVRAGARVAVVVESPAESVCAFAEARAIPFTVLPDPARVLYSAYGVNKGGIAAALRYSVVRDVVRARIAGYKHGKYEGTETQVPADFVIGTDGRLIHVHYGKHVADSTPPEALLAAIGSR
jgi:peroxiredoxin